jgi:hypothetical protein
MEQLFTELGFDMLGNWERFLVHDTPGRTVKTGLILIYRRRFVVRKELNGRTRESIQNEAYKLLCGLS